MDYDPIILDEAYNRLHKTGPEFRGWLSNHGPMAVEAMFRRGQGDVVQRWLDRYMRRLEPVPPVTGPIGDDWHHALGDVRRAADWTRYFEDILTEQPWQMTLNTWWRRLLPGIAAGATHGVIRVGHAVRALLTDGASPIRVRELAHGLAYWAARWKPITIPQDFWNPGTRDDSARALPTVWSTFASLPRLTGPDNAGGFDAWASRMDELPGWTEVVYGIRIPDNPEQIPLWLAQVVDTAVVRYLWYGHGDAIMLVHSATAPNAVWRVLPALDKRWWRLSALAAWIATATLTAIYASGPPADPSVLRPFSTSRHAAEEAFARAVAHGDEHVIKFADTAVDVYARTRDPQALAAIDRAAALIKL